MVNYFDRVEKSKEKEERKAFFLFVFILFFMKRISFGGEVNQSSIPCPALRLLSDKNFGKSVCFESGRLARQPGQRIERAGRDGGSGNNLFNEGYSLKANGFCSTCQNGKSRNFLGFDGGKMGSFWELNLLRMNSLRNRMFSTIYKSGLCSLNV